MEPRLAGEGTPLLVVECPLPVKSKIRAGFVRQAVQWAASGVDGDGRVNYPASVDVTDARILVVFSNRNRCVDPVGKAPSWPKK
jgi:hypothetical protein